MRSLEWNHGNELQKHHKGKEKSLSKDEFQKILQDIILDSGVTGMGIKDILLFIFGIPVITTFIKQRAAPNAVPNDVFIPAVTSASVFLLAKLNKIWSPESESQQLCHCHIHIMLLFGWFFWGVFSIVTHNECKKTCNFYINFTLMETIYESYQKLMLVSIIWNQKRHFIDKKQNERERERHGSNVGKTRFGITYCNESTTGISYSDFATADA